MKLVDPKVKKYPVHYVFQCALATLSMSAALMFLDVLTHTAIVTTLGATAFIVFALPHSHGAKARSLLGGYAIGMAAGAACFFASATPWAESLAGSPDTATAVFAALAVGLSIFLMTAVNCEHPPAGGIALGLVVNEWDLMTLVYVISAAVLFFTVRRLLRPVLVDLA